MSSTKSYLAFILEQLSDIPNLTFRPMMGEYLLYSDGILFGGVYDDRLLVKIAPENAKYEMPKILPYDGARKPMYLVEDLDDKPTLDKIIKNVVAHLKN